MISPAVVGDISDEERLVAELEALGVRYLSRQTSYLAERPRPADALIAGLVRQPSARVRNAVIAVLLARPDYAASVPGALAQLQLDEQARLRVLYTAAVALQQEHARTLRLFLGPRWRPLPNLFARELGVPASNKSPQDTLKRLGRLQQQQTGAVANWQGTFEDVAQRLLRQWELEAQRLFQAILPDAPKADSDRQEFTAYFEEVRHRTG